jgi:hypothetical protein
VKYDNLTVFDRKLYSGWLRKVGLLFFGGPLRKPWIIFAFPIRKSSKIFCGASWAPRATFKQIKKGGYFFGRNFFLSKSQFLTPEMDSRAKTK